MVSEGSSANGRAARAPIHLWIVGVLLVLWNGWGAALAITAQSGRLPAPDVEHAAYFETQPLWFVLFADVGPFAGIAGAVALLLQHRSACWLFGVQIAVLALANLYELIAGTSLLLQNRAAVFGAAVLFVLFAGQIAYARWMQRSGVLT